MVADSQPQPVVIYTGGIGGSDPGPAGWGALLTYGDHRREIHGFDLKVTGERAEIRAVIEALECLTRPMPVRVWLGTENLDEGVTYSLPQWRRDGWPADENGRWNIDLWRQLVTAAERHKVEWVPAEEVDSDNPDYERAWQLAEEAYKRAHDQLLWTVLTQFLADQRERCSERTFATIEDVIWTLRSGIDWYEGDGKYTIAASEIGDQLGHFESFLVHKEFAGPRKLRDVKRVMPKLLRWLQEKGHLDAAAVTSLTDRIKQRADSDIAVRKLVDALQAYVDEQALDVVAADCRVDDEYLEVREITDDSITFWDWSSKQLVGPITVASETAAMARPGWAILLSAARINGEWRLLTVANGTS